MLVLAVRAMDMVDMVVLAVPVALVAVHAADVPLHFVVNPGARAWNAVRTRLLAGKCCFRHAIMILIL